MSQLFRNLGLLLLGLLGMHLSTVTAHASGAGLLCVEGVAGESLRKGDVGCIDVMAWSWGKSIPVSIDVGGGGSTGKATFQDFNFTKFVDSSSEDFFRLLVTGSLIKGVEYRQYLDCGACDATAPYLTIKFRDSLMTSQSSAGSSGDRPVESLSLTFSQVSYCYRPVSSEGNLGEPQCFAWDVAKNEIINPPF